MMLDIVWLWLPTTVFMCVEAQRLPTIRSPLMLISRRNLEMLMVLLRIFRKMVTVYCIAPSWDSRGMTNVIW